MRHILTTLLMTICFTGLAQKQQFNRCRTYWYENGDSSSAILTHEEHYNEQGRLIFKHDKPFKWNAESKHYYFYSDSLLTWTLSSDNNNDSTLIIYHYNAMGLKSIEEYCRYEQHLKKDRIPGGCVITEGDRDTGKSWQKTNEECFIYDTKGKCILYDQFNLQTRHVRKYDETNRIIEDSSFTKNMLTATESYKYSDDGYQLTRTLYDSEGRPKHLKEKTHEYTPQYTFAYKYNKAGRVYEETISSEKGEVQSTRRTEYNTGGLKIRTTYVHVKDHYSISQFYLYDFKP